MLEIIKFENELQYKKDFLNFPESIYKENERMQNRLVEKELLWNKHVLSKYFKLHKFIVYSNQKVVARFALTCYKDDDTAYFGFFECIKDRAISDFVFSTAKLFAKKLGCRKMVGPVDASVWINYRLKINGFEQRPYTGEPYNKKYYYEMFEDNGFQIKKKYTSYRYKKLPLLSGQNKIARVKRKQLQEKGYYVKELTQENFDQCLLDIYELICEQYKELSEFKKITQEEFFGIFSRFKNILDLSFVKMIYEQDGKLLAYIIGIPDYENLIYKKKICWKDGLQILLKNQIRSKQYVFLTIGSEKEHEDLEKILRYIVKGKLHQRRSTYIGAFIKTDIEKARDKKDIIAEYDYVLMECDL